MQKLLSHLAVLSARTQASEKRILERATERDGEVAKRLDELRPSVMIDESAAQEYQSLSMERGQLAQVIGLANERLKNG